MPTLESELWQDWGRSKGRSVAILYLGSGSIDWTMSKIAVSSGFPVQWPLGLRRDELPLLYEPELRGLVHDERVDHELWGRGELEHVALRMPIRVPAHAWVWFWPFLSFNPRSWAASASFDAWASLDANLQRNGDS
jgi:hypothetical protein